MAKYSKSPSFAFINGVIFPDDKEGQMIKMRNAIIAQKKHKHKIS